MSTDASAVGPGPQHIGRRVLLAFAGGAATQAGVAASLPGNENHEAAVRPYNSSSDRLFFDVRDYGAKGDGVTNDTAAFIAANDSAAQVNGTVVVPGAPTPYIVDDLRIANHKGRWIGVGGGIMGSADGIKTTKAGAVLKRPQGSAKPLLSIVANGISVQNIFLDGSGGSGTGLQIDRGFEVKLESIFIENVNGIGIDIQGSCNTTYNAVFVNNCGSTALPAVRVTIGPADGVSINTLDLTGLTIEQCPGPYLDIGVDSMDKYPEFLRITNLHAELDNRSLGPSPNVGPLIRIGNARSVCFINPFIVGGPGPLIQYNRTQEALGGVLGGLQIIGGTLLGREDAQNIPETLVNLLAGDGFVMVGTRVDSVLGQAVKIAAGFGPDVELSAISSNRVPALASDARDMKPAVGPGAQAGVAPPPPSAGAGATDERGALFFGTGTLPAAGEMIKVTFKKPYDRVPVVNLTPGNAATAALGVPFVAVTASGFSASVPTPPASFEPGNRFVMYYTAAP
jgi:hypothetical protein